MQRAYKDLIKLYADREFTGKSINLNNVSHSRIREIEIIGETTEVGEGTKSPDNPFALISVTSPTITVNEQSAQESLILHSAGTISDSYTPLTGEYVQRVGKIVLDGTEYWNGTHVIDNTGHWYIDKIQEMVKLTPNNTTIPNIVCTHYPTTTYNKILYNSAPGVSIGATGILSFRVPYLTRADFNAFLAAQYAAGTPVTVLYELAEPITTTINQTNLKANIPNTTISLTEVNNLGSIRAILQTKGE